MDGAAITAGVGGRIEINGKKYQISARTVEFYGLVEAEIINLRGNPLDLIVQAAQNLKGQPDNKELVDTIAQVISNRFRNWRLATWADYGAFYDTPYGTAFQLWCCIKHNADCPTVEAIQLAIWAEVNRTGHLDIRDAIQSMIDRAGSEDALGNSTGPSQAATVTTGQP